MTLGLALLGLGVSIALDRTAWSRWLALVDNPVSLVGTAEPLLLPEPITTWLGGAAFNVGWLAVYLISKLFLAGEKTATGQAVALVEDHSRNHLQSERGTWLGFIGKSGLYRRSPCNI